MMYQVRIITQANELEDLFRLRYAIYIEELGKTFINHNNEDGVVQEAEDQASFHIGLYHGEILAGICRLYYPTPGDRELWRLHIPIGIQEQYRFSISSRLMLRKEYRNTKAILHLMDFVFDKNIRDGIDIGLIEVEPFLVRMYERFGFRQIGMHINEYGYQRVILFVNGRDMDHFKELGSSFGGLLNTMIQEMNQNMYSIKQHLDIKENNLP